MNASPQPKPRIALTMGDPAGIGPELCLQTLADTSSGEVSEVVVYGSTVCLERVARTCGLRPPAPDEVVDCVDTPMDAITPGEVQAECGRAAHDAIVAAVKDALAGKVDAVVTAPIHKESLQLAGVPYPGHTELLKDLTGAHRVCMMMASERITVALATTHIALADVPSTLTPERLRDTIELTADAMRRIGKAEPRLTVCALNPHAGEHGLFGREESELIEPVMASFKDSGILFTGPLPPDTAFIEKVRQQTDAYICMYHDQALIPFKMLAFDVGVNISLGLPIVRTSVDHGTAFGIAWQGTASPTSMREAIRWAVRLAEV